MTGTTFFGKYRGVVTDNADPEMRGRIQARVTDATGDRDGGWALPCAPFGGDQVGFFAVPKVGAGVWIEYEQGDPDRPVWSGCWWGSAAEMPPSLPAPPPSRKVMLRTEAGHSIVIDDTPGSGGITLETASGQKIALTAAGVEIDDGMGAKISLQGPKVSVNDGALEVL